MTDAGHWPRPTVRCLWEDLADKWVAGRVAQRLKQGRLPPPSFRLEELDHPALELARELLKPGENRRLGRIGAINDRVWLKVKKDRVRWRAAAHVIETRPWVGAAGWREDGSPDDFYQELEAKCEAAAKGLHQQKYSSDWMLPTDLDHARLRAEVEYRRKNVEPVERLRDLLSQATGSPGQSCEGRIGGEAVEVTAAVDADGVWVTLGDGVNRGQTSSKLNKV